VLLALGVLLLAHFIIVIHYDLSLFWLHIASLVLPFVFGFLYRQNTTEYLSSDLAAGILLAAVAIFARSAVVAEVDKVPVLPTEMRKNELDSAVLGDGGLVTLPVLLNPASHRKSNRCLA
jgi:hypothetical protein